MYVIGCRCPGSCTTPVSLLSAVDLTHVIKLREIKEEGEKDRGWMMKLEVVKGG